MALSRSKTGKPLLTRKMKSLPIQLNAPLSPVPFSQPLRSFASRSAQNFENESANAMSGRIHNRPITANRTAAIATQTNAHIEMIFYRLAFFTSLRLIIYPLG